MIYRIAVNRFIAAQYRLTADSWLHSLRKQQIAAFPGGRKYAVGNGEQISALAYVEEWLSDNLLTEIEKINLSFQSRKALSPPKHTDVSKIYAKIEKLKDLYINDLLPKEMYEKEYTALMTSLKDAENEKKELMREPIDLEQFNDFHISYHDLAPTAKKAFWSRTLNKIFLSENGEISITFN